MKYMGSKQRIAKYIVPIIIDGSEKYHSLLEPFCGGGNITQYFAEHIEVHASDSNKYLVAMLKGLQEGEYTPFTITKMYYDSVRQAYNSNDSTIYSDFIKGWVGFMASFNGRFFDGGYSGKHNERDYIKEQINNTIKQLPKLLDVNFYHSTYDSIVLDANFPCIIYCDPPYKGTKQYTGESFDYEKFYLWCINKHKEGHNIFISEYNMPPPFKCIWEKEVTNSLNTNKTYKRIEKLFTL